MKNYSEKTKILGTIHLTHEENENYTFEDVLNSIDMFNPDIIGVEIRPQDMTESNEYLCEYYPPEMVMVKEKYEKKISVIGFDWRGKSIEAQRIEKWLTDVPNLRHLMKEDKEIYKLVMKRKDIMGPFYENCTLEQCQVDYDYKKAEMGDIEKKLDELIIKSGHSNLLEYYKERENIICQRIKMLIQEHKNEKVMIITGMSHKPIIHEYLSREGVL